MEMYQKKGMLGNNNHHYAQSRYMADDSLDRIEHTYITGAFDECLSLIDKKYYHLRRYFTSTSGSSLPMHACNRDQQCECTLLTSYLLAIAFQRREREVGVFLASNGVYEPELRLPFETFTEWLQLEIYRGKYDKADDMLRNYIFQSTRLKVEQNPASN